MSAASRTPSLTPSRSPSPTLPVQPDHFYSLDNGRLPPSPDSEGRGWLDPADDPLAHRGIPVFRPTMREFEDFEKYVTRIERWGMRSGIVKVIPPKEWTDALPPLKDQLSSVKIRTPIEQHMLGRGGLFRQENIEKRRIMSVREWAELCAKDDYKAPGIEDLRQHARGTAGRSVSTGKKKVSNRHSVTADPVGAHAIKQEVAGNGQMEDDHGYGAPASPPDSAAGPQQSHDNGIEEAQTPSLEDKLLAKKRRQSRQAKDARLAERAAFDAVFLETFDPHSDWLPANTKATDYTAEFCQKLERQYWRNCGLGKPAWYGADTQGSLCTDDIKVWNVAHLPSTLSRLLPASLNGLPGVNTPYLYWGMWRATFAWHVEDMDLFSINFIHFGAPKFWYAIPQGRSYALEQTMRGYFPKDTSQCPQFLRHKSFLASPTLLAQSSCRPNVLVQQAGEFVITFPRGYHAGFNLGFNCAESVNFALDSWLELGRKAQACQCIGDSVRIDVNQLLLDREMECLNPLTADTQLEDANEDNHTRSQKRKVAPSGAPKAKRTKINVGPKSHDDAHPPIIKKSLTLKLGPRPPEEDEFPCCLCVSNNREGLLKVHDAPGNRDQLDSLSSKKVWLAHEDCANIVPETWVDELEMQGGVSTVKEKVVFGVDAIVKDRWNLNCSACTKSRRKAHGAPIQCTKGKCSKAFHISCARHGEDQGIVFSVVREVEKDVVLLDHAPETTPFPQAPVGGAFQTSPVPTSGPPEAITHPTQPRVLKVIRKVEVQVLCNQHNPAVAAAKKASRQEKIRRDLLALPSMAHIKIRVSAGVYEVPLIRVIEETGCVEVLWDRGIKREFKWGSVVFGSTSAQTVVQKPPPEAEHGPATHSNPLDPNRLSTTSTAHTVGLNVTSGQPSKVNGGFSTDNGNRRDSGAWSYQLQGPGYFYPPPVYMGYYRDTASTPIPTQSITDAGQHRARLLWQRPYLGQPANSTSGHAVPNPVIGSDPNASSTWAAHTSTASNASVSGSAAPLDTPSLTANLSSRPEAVDLKNLSSLSDLSPDRIAEVLRNNPELRDTVWAIVDQQRRPSS